MLTSQYYVKNSFMSIHAKGHRRYMQIYRAAKMMDLNRLRKYRRGEYNNES